jgi:prophage regulatory protein
MASKQQEAIPAVHQQYPFPQARTRLIRLPEVKARVGLSRSSIYSRISDGAFPSPIKLGPRSVAWLESSVDQWIEERLSQPNND